MRRAALVLLLGVAGRCWAEEGGAGESTKQWPTNEDTLPEKDDEGARRSAAPPRMMRAAPLRRPPAVTAVRPAQMTSTSRRWTRTRWTR